jgi:hypothetical protein
MSVSSGAGCSAAWAKPEMLTMMAIKEIMKGFDLILFLPFLRLFCIDIGL